MAMKTKLENITIVLVEPREAGNIGASCRAMKNMGVTQLRMVNPVPYLVPEGYMFCCGADDLLHGAAVHTSLEHALADMHFTIGVTRRKGKERNPVYWIDELIPKISALSQENQIALVFGREDKGLSNDELRMCHAQLSIPTRRDFPTLNLAQSVLLVCYELFLTKHPPQPTSLRLVSHERLNALTAHIKSTLSLLGYRNQGGHNLPQRIINGLRRIAGRAGIEDRDLQMIHGLCSQVELKLNEPSSKQE